MPQKKGLIEREQDLAKKTLKSEAEKKARSAERAADTRHRLGVVNPFSRNWKPLQLPTSSHPALYKV